jgi:glutamyl-tRNA reductase
LSEIDIIRSNKITFVDLSVPRNIKLKKKYKNVDLVDLDKLKDQVNSNYNKRISEIKKAESMLMKHTSEFNQWVENRELRPAIISIKKQFDQLISNSPKLNGNKKEVEEIYEKFSDKIIKNLIEVTNNGKNRNALEIINKIFSND